MEIKTIIYKVQTLCIYIYPLLLHGCCCAVDVSKENKQSPCNFSIYSRHTYKTKRTKVFLPLLLLVDELYGRRPYIAIHSSSSQIAGNNQPKTSPKTLTIKRPYKRAAGYIIQSRRYYRTYQTMAVGLYTYTIPASITIPFYLLTGEYIKSTILYSTLIQDKIVRVL